MSDLLFFEVDYAKSSKSTCFGSKKLIPQGTLRMGPRVQSTKGDFQYPQWHLFDYFEDVWMTKNSGKLLSVKQIKGFDGLKFEDQQRVRALIKGGEAAAAPSASIGEDTTKALAAESQLVWDMKKKVQENLQPKEIKDILEEAEQPFQGPMFGGNDRTLARLTDAMLFGWLPPCSECGGPKTCSNPGQMFFSKGKYKCAGYVDEFTKCVYTTGELRRRKFVVPKDCGNAWLQKFKFAKNKKVMASLGDDEEDLEKLAESLKAAEPDAPKAKKAKVEEEEDEPAVKGPPFDTLTVAIVGKMTKKLDDMEKLIKDNGGKISKTITKAVKFVVSNEAEVEAKSKKIQEADALKIPVVTEQWIWRSIDKAAPLTVFEIIQAKLYLSNQPEVDQKAMEKEERKRKAKLEAELEAKAAIEEEKEKAEKKKRTAAEAGLQEGEEAKENKKKKMKVKGRAPVEPESGLDEIAHVLDEGKDSLYHVTLNAADVTTGKNSYYILQLLESDDKKTFWLFRKWGRMNSTIGDKKLEEMTKAKCIKEFEKLYRDKTGNEWSEHTNFKAKPGKLIQLEVDFGADAAGIAASTQQPYSGKLAKSTQDLMNLIFDVKAMQSALMEMEIDVEKMPLGKLSKNTIMAGFDALKQVQSLLTLAAEDKKPDDFQSRITGLSNKFYSYIPHTFGAGKKGRLLDNEDIVKEKCDMLQALRDMEVAASILSSTAQSGEHPLDSNYGKLKCTLEEVPKGSDEFKILDQYVQTTHAKSHDKYTLEVVAIWKMDREGEAERYKGHSEDANRMLLYHGSRLTNWVGIISQGLRIAPPEAPSTGYMFGKGLYFADMSSKSANYCFTTSEKTQGIMALSEVALGKMYECTKAEYMDKPPKGFQSTFGKGKIHPDPANKHVADDGSVIPLGPGVESKAKSSLQYNEFIVYDVSQVKMKYLLRLEFHYKVKCGTFF